MSRTFPAHVITDDSALGGSVIERSLRFNNDDSAYLNRTPGSESTRRAVTLSVWLKRCNFGEQLILDAFINDSHRTRFMIDAGNRMQFFTRYSGNDHTLITNARQRDVSGWYHFVYAINTNESTASNRVKCYINGEQQTFTGSNYPDQEDLMFGAICNHTIGVGQDSGGNEYHFDGYMAEMHCIDGTQLDPTYFGYTDSQTGLWRPKKYTYGNYGTNGFYLNFKDNSSTSTLGKDTSGNGNNFTTNNFSVSAGAGNDSLEDAPTDNFCTLNSLDKMGTVTLSNGNLKAVINGDNASLVTGSLGVSSGKWYYEAVADTAGAGFIGWIRLDVSSYTGYPYQQAGSLIYFSQNGSLYLNGAGGQSYGTSYGNGDVIGCAIDLDNNKVTFYKNNSSQGTVSITAGTYHPNTCTGGSGATFTFNFGQRPFSYTPPAGHKTLNSKNLPPNVPSIIRPQKHFDTLLYTATGNAMTVTGLEFKPDLIWQKRRDSTGGSHFHYWFDIVRGGRYGLQSNTTGSEFTGPDPNITFTNNGFDMAASTGGQGNASGGTYVAWCWKAGGAAVTNTDGTINTQVSVNEEAGFSIATYTGNGATTATIGHGLGKTPDWIIIKNRSSSTDWVVMHEGIGSYDGGNYKHQPIKLNSDGAKTSILGIWQTPNSSTQQISDGQTSGSNRPLTNTSGDNYVAYCWTSIPGFSKFGSYTGNGNSDGPYVYLGFRPAWIMVKRTDSSNMWLMMDNKRYSYNVHGVGLKANDSSAEFGWNPSKDFLSNGFKIRTSDSAENTNGGTYIYMAFAEQPVTTPFDTFPNAR